jgi:hypothetical protein
VVFIVVFLLSQFRLGLPSKDRGHDGIPVAHESTFEWISYAVLMGPSGAEEQQGAVAAAQLGLGDGNGALLGDRLRRVAAGPP